MKKEAGIPGFLKTIEKMQQVHLSKNADYATKASVNPFYNFDITKYILLQFNNNEDKVFVWPIANKLARLAILLNSGEEPNNESIQDSLIDIANYVILWKCDLARRK
jgi:hypothetical protein